MPTTSDYLAQLEIDKQTISDNLETMGISDLQGDETFTELAPKILEIEGGTNFSVINYNTAYQNTFLTLIKTSVMPITITNKCTSLSCAFDGDNFSTLTFSSNCDTSNVTDMSAMFRGNNLITTLDLTNFNSSNVEVFTNMFANCSRLTSIAGIKNFIKSAATNIGGMFYYCTNLTSLDLSECDTSNVTNFEGLFRGCSGLTRIDIRNMTFDSATNFNYVFAQVRADCLIIVKSDTEKAYITSKYSTLTNVKTVAELENE